LHQRLRPFAFAEPVAVVSECVAFAALVVPASSAALAVLASSAALAVLASSAAPESVSAALALVAFVVNAPAPVVPVGVAAFSSYWLDAETHGRVAWHSFPQTLLGIPIWAAVKHEDRPVPEPFALQFFLARVKRREMTY